MKFRITHLTVLSLFITQPVLCMTSDGIVEPDTELSVMNSTQPQPQPDTPAPIAAPHQPPAAIAPAPVQPTPDVAINIGESLSEVNRRLELQRARLTAIEQSTSRLSQNMSSHRQFTREVDEFQRKRDGSMCGCVTFSSLVLGYLIYNRSVVIQDNLAKNLSGQLDNLRKAFTTAPIKTPATAAPTPTMTLHGCAKQCDYLRTMANLSHQGYWIPYPRNGSILFEFVNCTLPVYRTTTHVRANITTAETTTPMWLNMTNDGIVTSITPATPMPTTTTPNITMLENGTLVSDNTTEPDRVFNRRFLDGFPVCDMPLTEDDDLPPLVNATKTD